MTHVLVYRLLIILHGHRMYPVSKELHLRYILVDYNTQLKPQI